MLKKTALLAALLAAALAVLTLTARNKTFAVENSLVIAASSPAVWRELAAVGDWPHWWPGVEEARLRPAWQEEAVLDLVLTGNPKRDPARVLQVVAERRVAWQRTGILGSHTRTSLTLEPVSAGTRVFLESFIQGPQAVLAKFTGEEEFARYHELVLRRLDERVGRPERQP